MRYEGSFVQVAKHAARQPCECSEVVHCRSSHILRHLPAAVFWWAWVEHLHMRATREARPQRGHRLGARQLSWMIWISKEAEDHHRYGLALLKQKVRGERCMPERRAPAMRPQTPPQKCRK